MIYLPDTNACITLLRQKNPRLMNSTTGSLNSLSVTVKNHLKPAVSPRRHHLFPPLPLPPPPLPAKPPRPLLFGENHFRHHFPRGHREMPIFQTRPRVGAADFEMSTQKPLRDKPFCDALRDIRGFDHGLPIVPAAGVVHHPAGGEEQLFDVLVHAEIVGRGSGGHPILIAQTRSLGNAVGQIGQAGFNAEPVGVGIQSGGGQTIADAQCQGGSPEHGCPDCPQQVAGVRRGVHRA